MNLKHTLKGYLKLDLWAQGFMIFLKKILIYIYFYNMFSYFYKIMLHCHILIHVCHCTLFLLFGWLHSSQGSAFFCLQVSYILLLSPALSALFLDLLSSLSPLSCLPFISMPYMNKYTCLWLCVNIPISLSIQIQN